jgi:hypothetical protein
MANRDFDLPIPGDEAIDPEVKRERQQMKLTQLIRDTKAVIDTPEGKRFFLWFFRICPLFGEIFDKSSGIYFSAARHSVAVQVYSLLVKASPEFMVPKLFREDVNYGELPE